MQIASTSSRHAQPLFALWSAAAACLFLWACGDDGTGGLSECHDYRIQVDKMGEFHCAPRAGTGGAGTGAPRGGSGGSSQQLNRPPAGTPAAGSGNQPPPIPKNATWTCVQVQTTCTCGMTNTPVDSCAKPLPGCCVLVRESDKYGGCVCYAENSNECTERKKDPMKYVPVATCPP